MPQHNVIDYGRRAVLIALGLNVVAQGEGEHFPEPPLMKGGIRGHEAPCGVPEL